MAAAHGGKGGVGLAMCTCSWCPCVLFSKRCSLGSQVWGVASGPVKKPAAPPARLQLHSLPPPPPPSTILMLSSLRRSRQRRWSTSRCPPACCCRPSGPALTVSRWRCRAGSLSWATAWCLSWTRAPPRLAHMALSLVGGKGAAQAVDGSSACPACHLSARGWPRACCHPFASTVCFCTPHTPAHSMLLLG